MCNSVKFSMVLSTVMAICLLTVPSINAAPAKDGLFYFKALKNSMIEVVDEHQELFNQNPDGSLKNPKLQGKAYFSSAYSIFKTIMGANFSPKSLKGAKDPARISQTLSGLLQAGRVATAKKQKVINTEKDGSVKLKKFIPAVFGRLTAERFKEKTGIEIKQTTLGIGQYKARNPYNTPDEWEIKQLKAFVAADWPLNKGIGEATGNQYRFIKPIYIKNACLTCHGNPTGEKGPYGHSKEGYKVGDIRGGISVTMIAAH